MDGRQQGSQNLFKRLTQKAFGRLWLIKKGRILVIGLGAMILCMAFILAFYQKNASFARTQEGLTFLQGFQRPDMSQAYAHVTGDNFKSHIAYAFQNNGFKIIEKTDYENFKYDEGRYVLAAYPYETKYLQGRSDYLLVTGKRKIRIEAKWQQSKGSADTKAGHNVLLAITGRYGPEEIALILDGPGWTPGLINEYKSIAMEHGRGKVYIFTFAEFLVWIGQL